MDTNTVLNLAKMQLAALLTAASTPDAKERIQAAISTLDGQNVTVAPAPAAVVIPPPYPAANELDNDEPIIPDGFENRDQFENFVETQRDAFADAEEMTAILDNSIGVVGEGIDSDATELVNGANTLIDELHEAALAEGIDLPDVDANEFSVSYTRSDGNELTRANIETILKSQASQPLRILGTIADFRIEDGATPATKTAVLRFAGEGLNLEAIARGVVAYRGVRVFPGIGQVVAEGVAI